MLLREIVEHYSHWRLRKFMADDHKAGREPYAIEEWDKNCLLNEGIDEMWDLITGSGGDAYDDTNTRLGVGDSSAAAVATQTSLQAAVNKFWQLVDGAPVTTSQKSTWVATFADGDAEFAWEEYTVVNAANDGGANMNRAVESHGTKASGEVWELTLEITLS